MKYLHDIKTSVCLIFLYPIQYFQILRLGGTKMRQQNKPSLVQIMANHQSGTKPLFEHMLAHCELDPRGINISDPWIEIPKFSWQNEVKNVRKMPVSVLILSVMVHPPGCSFYRQRLLKSSFMPAMYAEWIYQTGLRCCNIKPRSAMKEYCLCHCIS